jgi:ankyrin repeat protein
MRWWYSLLLGHKNIDAKDDDGLAALHLVTRSGHEAMVRLLLNQKANVDAKDNDGITALPKAAEEGHEAVGRLLPEHKADVNAKDKGGGTAGSERPRKGTRRWCEFCSKTTGHYDIFAWLAGTFLFFC